MTRKVDASWIPRSAIALVLRAGGGRGWWAEMKFFTNNLVQNDYLLIKIQDYLKGFDTSAYKEVFIDPGVYELKDSPCYSWERTLNVQEFLNSLPENHYFSADYPSDMNLEFTDHFLTRSWDNAIMHTGNKHYITTVQSKFNDYWSFMEWFDRYNDLYIASGIMGLGNLCRILGLTEYMKHVLGYAFKKCKHPRIHIYGLSMRIIPHAYRLSRKYGIELSIDSTKWTRACTVDLKEKYNINCTNQNRQEFFEEYLKLMKAKGVSLQNDYVEVD